MSTRKIIKLLCCLQIPSVSQEAVPVKPDYSPRLIGVLQRKFQPDIVNPDPFYLRKQIQQLMRRVDGLSNLHVVSLNENVLFNHGFEKIKLKRVILT